MHKPHKLFGLWLLIPIASMALATDAAAIIIRHDVDDAEYVVSDEDYPALVDLFQPGDCIGTLIHESHLLTVAHCAEDLREGRSLEVAGVDHEIAEVVFHPGWDGWFDDIALVRFTDAVEGVTPLGLYSGTDELGSMIFVMGSSS